MDARWLRRGVGVTQKFCWRRAGFGEPPNDVDPAVGHATEGPNAGAGT